MTTSTFPQTFREAVAVVAEKARAILPVSTNGRIESAVKLVLAHDVTVLDDGTIEVGSSSDPMKVYHLVGTTCTCTDFTQGKAPSGWCKHRISAGIAKRVRELRSQVPVEPETVPEAFPDNDPEEPDAPAPAPAPTPPPLPEAPHSIDPRHIVLIQGRPFVKFAGLLDLAHTRGLQALQVTWTYNDAGLSLAQAVATFPFGTFTECGDASPENVTKKVAPHFRRCALTRAAARVLRVALGLDMVAAEELADE